MGSGADGEPFSVVVCGEFPFLGACGVSIGRLLVNLEVGSFIASSRDGAALFSVIVTGSCIENKVNTMRG